MEAASEETQKESTENATPNSSSNEPKAPSAPPTDTKKSKKDDRSKKDDKNLEQFMKTLNPIPTMEEKLSLVCKKYVQSTDENKKLQFYIKQSDKRYTLLLKEKEQLQLEFNKTVLVKSKLENLCRELQKQNKAIKEESLLKIREEEERRKETQAKFQSTLSEITALLQQNNEKNAKLRDDNISMSEKFKSVVNQYQLREQQVDKMAKQMALESQLSDAKLQKAGLEHQADKERLISELEQIKVTMSQYRAKILELQATETSLRGQLAVYTDKYDEFQNALVKSNQMFGGFKEQMEKMSKKIKKLEKESLTWKSRWETSQTALLDMCGERQAGDERAAAAARQLLHMQGLCRTLQAERTVLLATLKEHAIERPPVPTPPPAPVAPPPPPSAPQAPASNAKVDAMAANCAQLRQSLAHLQSQLNVFTNQQQTKEESPKPEKPEKPEKTKKSKSKKNKADKAQKADKTDTPKDESDEPSAKEVTNESPKITNESPSAVDEKDTSGTDNKITTETEKVDGKTLENLIQAINNANINLCDLEVVNDDDESEENSLNGENSGEVKAPAEITATEIKDETVAKEVAPPKSEESPAKKSTTENTVTDNSLDITNKDIKVINVSNTKESQKVETNTKEVKNDLSLQDDDKMLNINDVNEALAKLIEINKITDVSIEKDSQNTTIVSTNDEVSHINEVKSVTNT